MDSEEVPVTPTRRSSRRIQAKAELKTREITPEPEPVKSTRRSRSRSVTRNLSAEKKNGEERPTFQIVEEEVNEEAVIKVKEHKSPARKRGGRSRSITPTRIIPTRAATKSPAREPSTPVRLTRAARRQGYGTPDQSEQAKLVIAESPQTSVSPAPKLTKEQLVIVKTPTLILEDVLTSKTPMIQRFLKNWKDSQLNESVQEEPMEVSYAEEVDTEFRDRTEEQKGQGCRLDKRREETEEVPESNGQNVQTMDTEETVGEKSEKIEPTEKVVMETVTLCKSRVLKMEYSPPIELPEKTTYSSQEQEGENESRTESHKPVMVAETVQEEEKSTMTDSMIVLAETTVVETETENSIEHPEQTERHHEVVLFQEDHRSEQRTTLADVLSTSEEEKKLERAEDAEPIEDKNENEQSAKSQEPSAEPEPTGEETEIGDSYEVRGGTEEENVASPSEEDGTEHPCRNLRQALNLVWAERTYSVFTRSNGELIPAPVLSQTAVRQDFHSDARQIKDEPVSPISFRKIGARESAQVNEESLLVKSETVELEETDSEQETDGQENALRLKEAEHNLNATEQETMTLLAQFDRGAPAQIYVLDKNGQPVSKVSSPLAGSEERVTERQDERDSIGQETEIPSSEEAGTVSPQDSHSSPKEDVEQEDIGKHLPSEEALVLDEITQVSEAPKTEKRKKKKKKRLERDEEENTEKILNEDQGDEPATVPVLEKMAENTEVPKVEKRKKKKRKEAVEEEKIVTEKIEVEKQVAFEEAPILEKKKKKRRAVADEPLDLTEVSESVETLEEPAVFESQEGEGPKSEKRKKKRTVLEDTPELVSQEDSLAVEKLEQVAQSTQIKKKKKKRAAVKEALEEQENLADTPVPQSEEVIELEKKKKKKRKALPEQALSEVVEAQDEVKSIFVGEKPKKKKKVLTESNTEKEPELEPKVSKKEKKHKRKVQEDSQEPRTNKKNGKKTEKMVDLDEEASSGISYPDVTLKRMFNNPKEVSTELKDLLQSLYAWNNRLEKRADDLPDKFLNDDSETIWQFINHKNRQINKDWRKYKNLLDEPAAIDGLDLSDDEEAEDEEEEPLDEDFEDDDELVADEEEAEENEEDEEQDVDLFNLKDEDLKDLERELEAEHDSGEGTSDEREKENDRPRRTKKYPKSAVDDKFFNLAEMDAFCDEAEKQDDEEGLLATVDDTWGGPANYRYEDFFGKLDDVVGSRGGEDKKGKKRKVEASVSKDAKKKKSVRFALDEGEEEEEEPENEEEETEENGKPSLPVLLGQSKEDEKLESKLKTDIRKLQESIRRLEEENLEPRTWELSGEVTAQQRSENELLETHLQFDNANKRAPEVTEDFTEKLEAMIKQRIRDQAFDDVIRIKKVDEKVDIYRNDAIEEQEMMKKSLAEVYEKDYQKAAGETAAAATENPVHKGIQEKVDRLFHLIDAMSHFEYAPPSVRPEVKVVSNMAALRVEEVGMQASTDAQLLAPEEMKKKQKGELKAGDERSKTDKLRERRKKKTKQRAMVMKVGAEKALAGQLAAKIKKTKVPKADKEENLKSSNFFSKLQDTVQKEIKEKTTKKKKVKSQKVATGGSKFKL